MRPGYFYLSILMACLLFNKSSLASIDDSLLSKSGYIVHVSKKNKLTECFNYYLIDEESSYQENEMLNLLSWKDVLRNKEIYLGKYIHLLVVSFKLENWTEIIINKKCREKKKHLKYDYIKGEFSVIQKHQTIREYLGTSISTSHYYLCKPILSVDCFTDVYYLR